MESEIAKQIVEETKQIVESAGKEFIPVEFDDQPTVPTQDEKDQFSKQITSQIESGTEIKKHEQEEYRRMFGGDPKGGIPNSWTTSG